MSKKLSFRRLNSVQPAFTLVELSLAIAFVSVLLIAIAVVTTSIITIYQKTTVINAVSSTGREIIEDLSNTIVSSGAVPIEPDNPDSPCEIYTNATAKDKCRKDEANIFIYQRETTFQNSDNYPISGIFCPGSYSYVWVTAYALQYTSVSVEFTTSNKTYTDKGTNPFRLMRIKDPERKLCANHVETNGYDQSDGGGENIRYLLKNGNTPEELLPASEHNLILYDFMALSPARNTFTNQAFYAGSFVLATLRGGIDIVASENYCQEPSSRLDTDFNYCAFNQFNFAFQAKGGQL